MTGSGRRSARSRIKSSSTDPNDDDSLRRTNPYSKIRRGGARDRNSIPIFNASFKVMFGICSVAFFVILFIIHRIVNHTVEAQLPRVVTPFPAPKIMDLPQVNNGRLPLFIFGYFDFCLLLLLRIEFFWRYRSSKVSTRRVCIGELIALMCISEFVPGILYAVSEAPFYVDDCVPSSGVYNVMFESLMWSDNQM